MVNWIVIGYIESAQMENERKVQLIGSYTREQRYSFSGFNITTTDYLSGVYVPSNAPSNRSLKSRWYTYHLSAKKAGTKSQGHQIGRPSYLITPSRIRIRTLSKCTIVLEDDTQLRRILGSGIFIYLSLHSPPAVFWF